MSKTIQKRFHQNDLKLVTRIANQTINEERRTVDVVFSTGERGMRQSWDGPYYEELEISERAINFTRLNAGAPVLASHDSTSLDSVIGIVERGWVENGEAKATIRFAKDEVSDKIFQKVKDGILRNVSVGYNPSYEDVTTPNDKYPVYRATSWEPLEISVVPIGFDSKAQFRNQENSEEFKLINVSNTREIPSMTKEEQLKLEADAKEATQKQVEAARQAEQTRCLEIRKAVKAAGLNVDMADDYISRNTSIEDVKSNVEMIRKYTQETAATQVASTVRVEVGGENEEQRREAIVEATLFRMDAKNNPLTERAKPFAGLSLMRSLERHLGRKPFESDQDFATRVMTTSDFPLMLANVASKTAANRYQLAPKTFEAWTTSGTLKDYKPAMQVRGGDVGSLQLITEAGEYKESSIGEESESAQLSKYGVIHSFSDILLINDDLGQLLKIASEAGVAQARLDNQLAYAVLTGNPLMSDGNALFSAPHGNLGTPGVISETTFAQAFQAMRNQKSVDGRDTLNLAPAILVVGPVNEVAAKKFLATVQPNQTSSVNIFSNSVQVVVDSAITDDHYYFIADPRLAPSVIMNRLAGQESVKVDSRVNWRNDAIELKLTYSVQAKALDFRSVYSNENA